MGIKAEIQKYRASVFPTERVECTEAENEQYLKLQEERKPLPDDITFDTDFNSGVTTTVFYRTITPGFDKDEYDEYLKIKQLKAITTIKNCVVFFVVLAVIGLVASLITLLA